MTAEVSCFTSSRYYLAVTYIVGRIAIQLSGIGIASVHTPDSVGCTQTLTLCPNRSGMTNELTLMIDSL